MPQYNHSQLRRTERRTSRQPHFEHFSAKAILRLQAPLQDIEDWGSLPWVHAPGKLAGLGSDFYFFT